MEETLPLDFSSADAWRAWLAENHDKSREAWVVHYKVKGALAGLRYEEALREALAYGWIDGKVKSLDDDRFMTRYTPRKTGSFWSQRNKDIASELIRQGRMAAAGTAAVEVARANGRWDAAYHDRAALDLPDDLRLALDTSKAAAGNFQKFPVSARNIYVRWVEDAKTVTTRRLRIARVVARAKDNVKPGQAWKNSSRRI